MVVGSAELAKVLGVSDRTVRHWAASTDMPKLARNKYDLVAVVPWFVQREIAERLPACSDESRLLRAQADERIAKARMAQLRTQQAEGDLLEKAEVERQWIERVVAVKTALRQLGLILGNRVVGLEDPVAVQEVVDGEVYQCLLRFARADDLADLYRCFSAAVAEHLAEKLVKVKGKASLRKKIEGELDSDPWRCMKMAFGGGKDDV